MAIGDWLIDGKRHYGDGLYVLAEKVTGLDERTLEGLKQIADRFEITLCNVNLQWSHHKEVASIKKIEEITTGKDKGKLQLSDETDYEKISELLERAAFSW